VWTGGVLQGAAEDVVAGDQSHFTATLGISTSSLLTFLDFLFFFLGIGEINHASRSWKVETVVFPLATVLDYAYFQLRKGEKARKVVTQRAFPIPVVIQTLEYTRRPRCPKALALPKHDGVESAWEGRRLKFRAGFLGRPRPC
jgi:hypothetical protein